MSRRKITATIRFAIFQRDHNRCTVCGRGADDGASLEVDHNTPVAAGGTDDLDNLRTLCRECNEGKSDRIYRPVKAEPPAEVGIPVPAEYAIDQVSQGLRYFELSTGQRKLSVAQAVAVMQTPGISDGINPLFWPLPRSAIVSALLALDQEGKIRLKDDFVEILEFGSGSRRVQGKAGTGSRDRTETKIDLTEEILGADPEAWFAHDNTGTGRLDASAIAKSSFRGTLRRLVLLLEPDDEASKHDIKGFLRWLDKASKGEPLEPVLARNFVDNLKRLQDALEVDLNRWRGGIERKNP